MDSLITAAARALAAGDVLGALNRVALRDDAPALALRGIAMARLGDFDKAKELLKRAARTFGAKEAVSRARCIVAEGAHVGRNSVLGAGLVLTGTVPVIDAATGAEIGRGRVPPNSVAVMATRSRRFGSHEYGLPCALVIKHLREGERHDKNRLNDILRDHGASL